MIFLSDYLRIFTRGGNVSNPSHQYINKSTINLSFHWKLKYMVTNGNWASINTNTNTNLPSSVLAASLFYCLVEYPLFLMIAVASILPGQVRFWFDCKKVSRPKLCRTFGTNPAHRPFSDPKVLPNLWQAPSSITETLCLPSNESSHSPVVFR